MVLILILELGRIIHLFVALIAKGLSGRIASVCFLYRILINPVPLISPSTMKTIDGSLRSIITGTAILIM